ncbi:MAG: hypothetical protein JWQ84_1900 [Mucilaginibacter sp.]|jgi:hypothetical protein|nr:hypothetical protein [Mucilaginibacter sp.]MDB5140853.1 hypothetical protein [Mucilaginibacter sp.]
MRNQLICLLRYAAICGNVLFILWISFNAMDEGFQGTVPEKISAVVLIALLATNAWLLVTYKSQSPQKTN